MPHLQQYLTVVRNQTKPFMEKLYVVKGGINKKKGAKIDETFFLITSDFKSNHGYIGKRSNKMWRLYTSVGRKIRYVADPSWYEHYPTFEGCIEKLKALSTCEVVVLDFHYKEEEEISQDSYVTETDLPLLQEVVTIATGQQLKLTAGALYKLELYLESLKNKNEKLPEQALGKSTFETILDKQMRRLDLLRVEFENEQVTIRPEDIPDLE